MYLIFYFLYLNDGSYKAQTTIHYLIIILNLDFSFALKRLDLNEKDSAAKNILGSGTKGDQCL